MATTELNSLAHPSHIYIAWTPGKLQKATSKQNVSLHYKNGAVNKVFIFDTSPS